MAASRSKTLHLPHPDYKQYFSEVKLIPVYYVSIVTGWGCTFCLHAVVGEGWYHKDFLNPLLGPKSRSAVCGYCHPWPFTLLIYLYV